MFRECARYLPLIAAVAGVGVAPVTASAAALADMPAPNCTATTSSITALTPPMDALRGAVDHHATPIELAIAEDNLRNAVRAAPPTGCQLAVPMPPFGAQASANGAHVLAHRLPAS